MHLIQLCRSSALLLVCFSFSAHAGLFDARKACEPDVQKFCKDIVPGGGRIIKCLKEHAADLSADCKDKGGAFIGEKASEKKPEEKAPEKKVEEKSERKAEWEEACGEEVKKLCADVKPGEGRIIECMKAKSESLSVGCKAQIEKAKDRFRSK